MTPRGRRVARNPSQKKVRPKEGKHTGWGQTMSRARASPVEAGAETSVEKETQRLWGHLERCSLLSLLESFKLGNTLGHLGKIWNGGQEPSCWPLPKARVSSQPPLSSTSPEGPRLAYRPLSKGPAALWSCPTLPQVSWWG